MDTPYFEKTPVGGQATLRDLNGGRYTVRVWYPDVREEPAPYRVTLTDDERVSVSFVIGRAAHGHP